MRVRSDILAVVAFLSVACGCAMFDKSTPRPAQSVESTVAPTRSSEPSSAIIQAGAATPPESAFANAAELNLDDVIAQVVARNPTLMQMTAAVELAASRYPQVTSLDDPTLGTWLAPASLGSNKVNDSARFELVQRFPYPGKRALRGEAAQAQATAAGHDLHDSRLQLIESARAAFADYYLAERSLEVNAEGLKLLDEFKRNAESRYQTGQVPQQDILQADVELGRQSERKLILERMRKVAVARLNTLMNLPPDSRLPPTPKAAVRTAPVPDAATLCELALNRRPDLQAIMARISADETAMRLAEREYYPDIEAMAAYDSFWQAADNQQRLRPQVGLRLNLPIRTDRRRGAVSEAHAQIMQRKAELAQRRNQVAFEVEQAVAQVSESVQTLRLYEEKILPAARANVKAAQTTYMTGKIPFLSLVEAQRNLIELQDRYYQAGADYQQRLATLERVAGGSENVSSTPPSRQPGK